jgi:hypothetical protein
MTNKNQNWWPEFHQVAIHVPASFHGAAVGLLRLTGNAAWTRDTAMLHGEVWDEEAGEYRPSRTSAVMSFNYEMLNGRELEIVSYIGESHHQLAGTVDRTDGMFISHMSTMTEDADGDAANFIEEARLRSSLILRVVHRFETFDHTNEHVAFKKRFKEVVVGTRHICGFDLKFIERLYAGPWLTYEVAQEEAAYQGADKD